VVVSYGLMDSHKDKNVSKFRTPTSLPSIFQRGKVGNFQRGNFVVYWWWMQRNGARN